MVSDDAAARVAEVRHVLERCVGTHQSVALSPQDAAAWLAALAAAEAARDDFTTSTYEMLGELLEAHQITPEPCPGGPCVANALIAIGERLTAAEQRAARLAAALQWAVTTLDRYQVEMPGTAHWMAGWADWLEQQARPALAAPPGEEA